MILAQISMSPENLLLGAVSALTAALSFVARLLWSKVGECETDRRQMRTDHETIRMELHSEINTIRLEYLSYVKGKTENRPCPQCQGSGRGKLGTK